MGTTQSHFEELPPFSNGSVGLDLSEPDPRRKKELERAARTNLRRGAPPYARTRINTFGELLWILLRHKWSGGIIYDKDLDERATSWFTQRLQGITSDTLHQADLRRADLSEVTLRGCDLMNANLEGADLSRCDLSKADLRYTSLVLARLDGAKLEGAITTGASFQYADLLDEGRAQELRNQAISNEKMGLPPWQGVAIRNRRELLWILREWAWTGEPEIPKVDQARADFRNAIFIERDQSGIYTICDLNGADVVGANFNGAELIPAERQQELQTRAAQNPKKSPYKEVEIESFNELLWVLSHHNWSRDPFISQEPTQTKRRI